MVRLADIHSLTDFKRNTASFLRRLKKSGTPHILTVNGEARLVVMDAQTYERLSASMRFAEDVEAVRRGQEDVDAGRTRPAKQGFDDLRRRLKIPGKQ